MAKDEDVPTDEGIASSFQRLKQSAAHLNQVADGLGREITDVEYALKRLNLGVEAWVEIARNVDSNGAFWCHEVGYARVASRWCLAVRTIEGSEHDDPTDWRFEEYPFPESPRRLRRNAAKKLPQLLDKLKESADETANDLTQEIAYAQQFVEALKSTPYAAQQQAAALKRGAQAAATDPRTATELQLEALRGRAAQPTPQPPPTSAKEADARILRKLKELDGKVLRQGAIDAPKKG